MRLASTAGRSVVLSTVISLSLCGSLFGHADAAEVHWPSRGVFPAYEQAESERGVHAYAFGEGYSDDNLFRLSDEADPLVVDDDGNVIGGDKGDRYARLGGGVRANLDWQRQSLQFDANASHYSFDRYTLLDRWLYDGHLQWKWQAGDRFSGSMGYRQSRVFPNFAELQFASQDVVTRKHAHFGLDIRLLSRLELRMLAEAARFAHKDPLRRELNNDTVSGTGGLFYVSPLHTAAGVQYKVTDGDYPNRQVIGATVVDNEYRETESSFVFVNPAEADLAVDFRIGYTERKHEDVPERDFQGGTGRLQLRFTPTAKTMLQLAAYRELRAVEDLDASYAVVSGGSFGPAWAPTSKLILQLNYVYEDRELEGDPGFILFATPQREDKTRFGQVLLGYEPSDHFRAAVSYERGSRTSNVYLADYDYGVVALNLTLSL